MSLLLKRPRETVEDTVHQSKPSACHTAMYIIEKYESKILILERKNQMLEDELFLHNTSVEATSFVKQIMNQRAYQKEIRRQQINVYDDNKLEETIIEREEKEAQNEYQPDLENLLIEILGEYDNEFVPRSPAFSPT
jgi:Fe-S-cluster containining protein